MSTDRGDTLLDEFQTNWADEVFESCICSLAAFKLLVTLVRFIHNQVFDSDVVERAIQHGLVTTVVCYGL